MSHEGLMTITQYFCAGCSPFTLTRSTQYFVSAHWLHQYVCYWWGGDLSPSQLSPHQPWLLRALLSSAGSSIRGSGLSLSLANVSLSALSDFLANNSLAFLCTATPGVIYGLIHELYTIIMLAMERDRAKRSSALLRRIPYLSPCFILSYASGMGASPSNLFQYNVCKWEGTRSWGQGLSIYQYLKLCDLSLHKTHLWCWGTKLAARA